MYEIDYKFLYEYLGLPVYVVNKYDSLVFYGILEKTDSIWNREDEYFVKEVRVIKNETGCKYILDDGGIRILEYDKIYAINKEDLPEIVGELL